MAIKAGQILHAMNQFVVDRLQSGGAGALNIPQEKVFELGNYQSVGIVRDVPDLTFSLEGLDVDTEIEALVTGSTNPGADPVDTVYEFSSAKTMDIISPWKSPDQKFEAVHGVAIPALTLESASYRYGLRENAGETFSLRGDQLYYVPGTPYQEISVGTGAKTAFAFGEAPLEYVESGKTLLALSVTVDGLRVFRDADYTEAAGTGVTFRVPPPDGARVSIVYGSAVIRDYAQTVHQGLAVKPAAIRGKDIDVFFNVDPARSADPTDFDRDDDAWIRWPDVQSATVEWRQTLEDDYEFGNPRAVSREATDVPAVTGAIEIRPRTVEAFFARLRQVTGVTATDRIMGPASSVAGALYVELRNPESGGTSGLGTGVPLKAHHVPNVRFTMPGYEGRVQQKLATTLNYESEDGVLEVVKRGEVTGDEGPQAGVTEDTDL